MPKFTSDTINTAAQIAKSLDLNKKIFGDDKCSILKKILENNSSYLKFLNQNKINKLIEDNFDQGFTLDELHVISSLTFPLKFKFFKELFNNKTQEDKKKTSLLSSKIYSYYETIFSFLPSFHKQNSTPESKEVSYYTFTKNTNENYQIKIKVKDINSILDYKLNLDFNKKELGYTQAQNLIISINNSISLGTIPLVKAYLENRSKFLFDASILYTINSIDNDEIINNPNDTSRIPRFFSTLRDQNRTFIQKFKKTIYVNTLLVFLILDKKFDQDSILSQIRQYHEWYNKAVKDSYTTKEATQFLKQILDINDEKFTLENLIENIKKEELQKKSSQEVANFLLEYIKKSNIDPEYSKNQEQYERILKNYLKEYFNILDYHKIIENYDEKYWNPYKEYNLFENYRNAENILERSQFLISASNIINTKTNTETNTEMLRVTLIRQIFSKLSDCCSDYEVITVINSQCYLVFNNIFPVFLSSQQESSDKCPIDKQDYTQALYLFLFAEIIIEYGEIDIVNKLNEYFEYKIDTQLLEKAKNKYLEYKFQIDNQLLENTIIQKKNLLNNIINNFKFQYENFKNNLTDLVTARIKHSFHDTKFLTKEDYIKFTQSIFTSFINDNYKVQKPHILDIPEIFTIIHPNNTTKSNSDNSTLDNNKSTIDSKNIIYDIDSKKITYDSDYSSGNITDEELQQDSTPDSTSANENKIDSQDIAISDYSSIHEDEIDSQDSAISDYSSIHEDEIDGALKNTSLLKRSSIILTGLGFITAIALIAIGSAKVLQVEKPEWLFKNIKLNNTVLLAAVGAIILCLCAAALLICIDKMKPSSALDEVTNTQNHSNTTNLKL